MLSCIAGTTGDRLAREFIEHADEFDLLSRSEDLANRRIMLAAGDRDAVAPPQKYCRPLVDALEARGAGRIRYVTLDDDHHFLDSRIELARAVVEWLTDVKREAAR
jgi:hypothetical protein